MKQHLSKSSTSYVSSHHRSMSRGETNEEEKHLYFLLISCKGESLSENNANTAAEG